MTAPTDAQLQAAFLAARKFGKILDDEVLAAIIAAGTAAPEVRVTRYHITNCQPGQRDQGYVYQTTGPDGSKWDNKSIVTLRDLLRRRYGRDLKITETWKAGR